MIFRTFALCGCLAVLGCNDASQSSLEREAVVIGGGGGSGAGSSGGGGGGITMDASPVADATPVPDAFVMPDASDATDAGDDPPDDLPIATECAVAEGPTSNRSEIDPRDIVGMPPGCCDTTPPTAGLNTCWGNSPMGQCGRQGQNNGLPPTMGSCIGLWTRPPTFDSALKYCMCRTMPNDACFNNVRACLACANGTHAGGANPAPPFTPGTGFPAGGCFVIPVAELYCYNNVGCTLGQQAALAAAVACQLPFCTGWATGVCKRAKTC